MASILLTAVRFTPHTPARKVQSITFRLDEPVLDALRQGVDEEGISLNNLANRQLMQYAEWDRLAEKIGFVSLSMRHLRSIIAHLSDEAMAEIGRELGAEFPREIIAFHWKDITLENFLLFVRMLSKYAHHYEANYREQDGEHVLILFHRLSEKWSIYLEAYMISALENLLGVKPKTYRTEQSVSVTFQHVPVKRVVAPTRSRSLTGKGTSLGDIGSELQP